MDWAEIGTQIILGLLGLVLSGLGILSTYLINRFIKNDKVKGYVNDLNNIVKECVQEVYQTYVEELKKTNAFNKESQREALLLCLEKVMLKLPTDLKKWLDENQVDLKDYLITLIESTIYSLKATNKK